MKPYMAGLVSEENIALFKTIERLIEALPDIDLGKNAQGCNVLVSCCMIVRGLARVFSEVERHDGYFGGSSWHSWLTIINDPRLIIDPYPVAQLGGAIMVHSRMITTPWSRLYTEARIPDLGGQEFLRHVDLVTRALKETLEDIALQTNASASS